MRGNSRTGRLAGSGSRWFFFLFLIVVLLPIGPALAQDAGQVVSVLGGAEVWRDGRWQAIDDGATLAPGEVVRTGEGGRLAILLANGVQLKLNANSQLELKQVNPPTEGFAPTATQVVRNILRMLNGEIWVRNGGEPLEIQTVPATATIRGTEFNLAVDPGDTARLAVLNGLVEFSNPQGSVLVAANEQASVKLGEAPRKTVLLNPLDAVQWSLYYPDPVGPAAAPVRDPQSPRYWTQAAQAELLRGRPSEARRALDRALALDPNDAAAYSLRSNIELVQNRKAEARADAERAVAADPKSSVGYLSLSLARQAEFDLNGALAAARQAVKHDPANVRALIQESSLLFGMGRMKEAVKVAERARQQAPDDAMVNTVWGFLQLARYRPDDARDAFQAAIGQDSTLGLPHLGLSLVLFQRNQTDAAVAEMRKATLLEPMVSLYNSYLGKAFYEVKDDRRAQKYLDAAKQLDPRDPTPWFYNAIRLQSINRPVEAVQELQKSIELNDDRGVYRSRLLLDEDLAARAATLGRIYNEVGFTELGLQEGWQSVTRDPTNYSAHRLLADSYAAFPNVEAARASELLQAQLLQPVNITPVSPRMAETKLLIPSGGPITPSLYEFNPLFVQNQPTLFFSGLGGSQDTWGDELILSGLGDQFSYSLGQFHYQSNGYRDNNDLKNDLYNLFTQVAISPDFNLQVEYRHRETTTGDLASRFDGTFRRFERREINQDTARVGARYSLSPQTNIIASIIYIDRDSITNYPNLNLNIGTKAQGYQAEAQLLYKTSYFNFISGFGTYLLNQDSVGFSESSDRIEQEIAYGYANIKWPENLIWTVGLSYQSDDNPVLDRNELNPKFGVQWAINDDLSLRAAAFQAVKRTYAIEQTIEPTQVAGFNQFFDNLDVTLSKNYGLGLDVRLSRQFYGGLEAVRRDIEVPVGSQGSEFFEIEKDQEDNYQAYLYWLPNPQWAVSAAWRYEQFKLQEGQYLRQLYFATPVELKTISIPLAIRYFNPSGFFAGLGVTYVNQDIQNLDPQSLTVLPTQNEDFVLVDASLGYRLPKRWGIVALEARNLFDQQFYFQDYSFQNVNPGVNPRFIPERTLYARFVLNF
ncbi:MAG: TonB-dependent receptor [Candidatus Contendobacter sp.]|nr:TonB-dependent receptor [Candidatus Contendobacter sp.]MDG4558558.1 TonB-dependent receptor [Candidatus Contendobacter sp.]